MQPNSVRHVYFSLQVRALPLSSHCIPPDYGPPFRSCGSKQTSRVPSTKSPVLGVKRTLIGHALMSAYDPKRTLADTCLGISMLRSTLNSITDSCNDIAV